MLKILVNAYACSPYLGSEPGMGWNFIQAISKNNKVVVITELDEFKKDIEKKQIESPELFNNLTFYYIRRVHNNKIRKIWPPSYYWYYKAWQKDVYKLAKKLDLEYNFDIIHQLNMVGFREPGFLWKLNKPLVWGPIGGLEISPWKLLPSMGLYGMCFYGCRNIINLYQMHFLRRVKKCALKSHVLISATQETKDKIKRLWGKDSIVIPEVGLLEEFEKPEFKARGSVMKVCWSGQHTPGKSLNLFIEAISKSRNIDNLEIHIIGKGVCTNKCIKIANQLKINSKIIWHGWIQKKDAVKIISQCDLFCITSLKDITSTVLLEALSLGLPVITFDLFGFSNIVDSSCGIKIPANTKKQIIGDLANAIDFFFEHESIRQEKAINAYKRANEYDWSGKMLILDEIYNSIKNNPEMNK